MNGIDKPRLIVRLHPQFLAPGIEPDVVLEQSDPQRWRELVERHGEIALIPVFDADDAVTLRELQGRAIGWIPPTGRSRWTRSSRSPHRARTTWRRSRTCCADGVRSARQRSRSSARTRAWAGGACAPPRSATGRRRRTASTPSMPGP